MNFTKLSRELVLAVALVVALAVLLTRSKVLAGIFVARRAEIFVTIFASIPRWTVALIRVGSRDTLAMHAWIIEAVVDNFSYQHIVVCVALTRSEWTRAKEHALSGNFAVVKHQTRAVKQAAKILPSQN